MEGNVSLPFQNNVTQQTNGTYILYAVKQWMCITVPPFIVAFGTFRNVMTLVALRRIGFGTTNLFLRALAVSDLVLLYNGLFELWLNLSFNITVSLLHNVTCKLNMFLTYSSGILSAWLIVAMTLQRALSVVWPHRIHLMCTRRKTLMFIAGIICFVFILHAHFWYGTSLKKSSDSTLYVCNFITDEYNMFMGIVWSWIDLLCFSFLPFVFLVISNFVLVWKLKASMRNVTLTAGHSDNSGVREKRASSITVTLIAVSLTFLALNLPTSLILIIGPYVTGDRYKNDLEFRVLFDFIFFFLTFLWYANSAVNFYIYCLTGNKFRAEIKVPFVYTEVPITAIEIMKLQNPVSASCSSAHTILSVPGQTQDFL